CARHRRWLFDYW
nr:immunoglobulin heavy chain junction region [Macaca mulatta]